MALSNNKKSLCNKLVSDFDLLVQPGKTAKGAINSATNGMKSKLNGMTFSDPGLLNDSLDGYRDAVSDNLPGDELSDLEDIKGFIDDCDYLQFLDPVSAMMGAIGGIFNEINNLVYGLDLNFPEYSAGGLGSLVDKLLNGIPGMPGADKISDLLAAADKLINCLSSGCATYDPTYIQPLSDKTDELQQVYDDLGVIDDPQDVNYGKYDYTAMYNEVGLTTQEVSNIQSVKTGINASKDAGTDAIAATTDAMKTARKLGEFI